MPHEWDWPPRRPRRFTPETIELTAQEVGRHSAAPYHRRPPRFATALLWVMVGVVKALVGGFLLGVIAAGVWLVIAAFMV